LTEANAVLRRRKLGVALIALRFVPGLLRQLYAARDRFIFGTSTR
jgi:hypothetical protein